MTRLPLCRPALARLASALLVLAACGDGPLAMTSAATTTGSTGDGPTATTPGHSSTVEPPTTTQEPEPPTTTQEPEPSTSDAPTGGPVTGDSSTGDATTGATTTTGEPSTTDETTTGGSMVECGPPCGVPWVLPGDLDLEEGDDLAQYACLVELGGELELNGAFTADELAVFANLRKVEALGIHNAAIGDVAMFACLETVTDSLTITTSPNLVDVSALAKVRVAPDLYFYNVPIEHLPPFAPDYEGLVRLRGFQLTGLLDLDELAGWKFTEAVNIYIESAPVLTSIAGLAAPVAANAGHAQIEFRQFTALTSLAGLDSLSSGSVALRDLPKVANLLPLANLGVAQGVVVAGMPKVQDLQGLHKLTEAYYLHIGDCDAGPEGSGMAGLTDLDGLDSLESVDTLGLGNNTKLTALTGAPKLHVAENIRASGNPALTKADYDALVAQLDMPAVGCIGEWDGCYCGELMP